jgi:hypothetical protein
MLSFRANSRYFVFSHISISTFVGFHGLNMPLYTVIFYTILSRIPLTKSHAVPAENKNICWLFLSSFFFKFDLGLDLNKFPTKPSKTIDPPSKPKGNTTHIVYCAVSPEIVLWETAMLRCLQSRKEWG